MNKIDKIIIVGDRVLIRPEENANKTTSGLFLPPGISEKERVQSGYIIKTGPGYAVSAPAEDDEPWKESKGAPKYIPLQAKEGDLAVFLKKEAVEIEIDKEKFLVIPQAAILLLFREDFLSNL